ncbi:NADPH:quinone reductase [Podochytrium sp. JEL0797]|nr:NADPH:quinone reductase [Podochytrium sp. JEL0797]
MMRAALFRTTGPSTVLECVTNAAKPVPAAGQLLVKNHFIGVNFIDTYHRTGLYKVPLPYIPGREASGIVEALGDGVTGFSIGDRVAYLAGNTCAEYALATFDQTVKVPAKVSMEEAAALLLQGATAMSLTRLAYSVQKGDFVLIHAAAGGTGQMLVQICKEAGAMVIGTTSSNEKAETARKAGADHVVLYTQQNVKDEVMKITGGKGVQVVYDGIGKTTFDVSLSCLARLGTMASFGNASGKVADVDIMKLVPNAVRLMRPSLFSFIKDKADFDFLVNPLMDLYAAGKIKIQIHKVYELSDIKAAHDDLEVTSELFMAGQQQQYYSESSSRDEALARALAGLSVDAAYANNSGHYTSPGHAANAPGYNNTNNNNAPSYPANAPGHNASSDRQHQLALQQLRQNELNMRRGGDKKGNLYKTEFCRSMEETGECRYANKCQFAHSLQELRLVDRHPKYKTQLCKTFYDTGDCPYGRRCCFIHSNVDLSEDMLRDFSFGVTQHGSVHRSKSFTNASPISNHDATSPPYNSLNRISSRTNNNNYNNYYQPQLHHQQHSPPMQPYDAADPISVIPTNPSRNRQQSASSFSSSLPTTSNSPGPADALFQNQAHASSLSFRTLSPANGPYVKSTTPTLSGQTRSHRRVSLETANMSSTTNNNAAAAENYQRMRVRQPSFQDSISEEAQYLGGDGRGSLSLPRQQPPRGGGSMGLQFRQEHAPIRIIASSFESSPQQQQQQYYYNQYQQQQQQQQYGSSYDDSTVRGGNPSIGSLHSPTTPLPSSVTVSVADNLFFESRRRTSFDGSQTINGASPASALSPPLLSSFQEDSIAATTSGTGSRTSPPTSATYYQRRTRSVTQPITQSEEYEELMFMQHQHQQQQQQQQNAYLQSPYYASPHQSLDRPTPNTSNRASMDRPPLSPMYPSLDRSAGAGGHLSLDRGSLFHFEADEGHVSPPGGVGFVGGQQQQLGEEAYVRPSVGSLGRVHARAVSHGGTIWDDVM